MEDFINIKEVIDHLNPITEITTEKVTKNRKLLLDQKWYVKLEPKVAVQQAESIKYILKNLFDLEVSWGSEPRGITNVDFYGQKWNSIMWSQGGISPNCDVYEYNNFIIHLLLLADIKIKEGITKTISEIQKLNMEMKEKITEIDKAAENMKNKLEKNYKKQIDFLLDSIGSLE